MTDAAMGSFDPESLEDPFLDPLIDYNLEMLEEEEEEENKESEGKDLEDAQINVPEGLAKGAVLNHPEDLFFCILNAYKRQFKGQSSGTYIGRWEISSGSCDEFVQKVWNLSKEHLAREIVFVPNTDGTSSPTWSSDDSPAEGDFDKFALFQSGRRNYTLDKLKDKKANLLQNWRSKEISLYLHIYSLSINSRAAWNAVKEVLIDPTERDRSGAAVTQAVFDLSDELRALHGNHLEGHGMAWSFWANTIQNSAAHLRESMKEYPPQHLAHLFQAKESSRVSAMRRELTVAHSVNSSYYEELTAIRQAYDVLESDLNNVMVSMRNLKNRVEALEIRDRLSMSLISAMETSVNVQEDQLGVSLRSQITDMEDIDHL